MIQVVRDRTFTVQFVLSGEMLICHPCALLRLYSTEFVLSVSRKTGIILDPVYAGKAALGMVTMMQEQPERFRGNRVLFIHTG